MNSELLDDQLAQKSDVGLTPNPIHHVSERSIYLKGLFGMILCILPGAIIGLVFIKMSLDQAKEARIAFKENPERYLPETVKKVELGRKLALIGLGLFIFEIVFILAFSSM